MRELRRFGRSALLGVCAILPSSAETGAPDWQTLTPSPVRRFEAASAVHEGKLYVLGGFGPGVRAMKQCDAYDPETNTWTRLCDLPQALTHINTVVDGQVIWIAGGFETSGRGPAVSNVWKYHIETDTFEAGPALPDKRAGGGLAKVGRTAANLA